MNKNKKVLIVCWSFPPNTGIGGRRWGKFAKYLKQNEFEIFVIKEKNSVESKDGQKTTNIEFFEIEKYWLVKQLNNKSSFFNKLKNKFAFILIKIFFKGTPYDNTLGLERKYVKLVKKVVEEKNIDCLIVTGAPFNLLYYTSLIKFPANLITIADFRDPWIEAPNYGMLQLNKERKSHEIMKQNMVLQSFSIVTTPSDSLTKDLIDTGKRLKLDIGKFKTLAHAFDKDDYINLEPNYMSQNQIIRFVYAGTIYIGTDSYFSLLNEALYKYNMSPKNLVKIEIDILTKNPSSYQNTYPKLNFKDAINENFYEVLNSYDTFLLIYGEHNKDFKTTKFYEYLPYLKPLIYIGPEGAISNFILFENLGFYLVNIEKELELIVDKIKSFKLRNQNLDIYSYKKRTNDLIDLMTKL